MFYLFDETKYIKKVARKVDKYETTTLQSQATEFTYKDAKLLTSKPKASLKWMSSFKIVDVNGEPVTINPVRKWKEEDSGENGFEFDESIIESIGSEASSIMGLAAWDINQLESYKTMLLCGLSYYDSAISDVRHAMLDKKPAAHIRTKIYGVQSYLEARRRDVKQTIRYVEVMTRAVNEGWSISKLKLEIINVKYVEYKGRTKYFSIINEILES